MNKMADEYANVTINGKTFDVKVPKGAPDNFVTKAAKEHYNQKYATGMNDAALPDMQPPVVNSPDFQKMEQTGGEGFFSSAGRNLADKFHAITEHPLDTIRSMMPSTETYDPKDPKRPGGPEWDPFYDVPFKDTIFKATHGNIPGALGDIAPDAAIAAGLSPKIRGAIGGGIRGLADATMDTHASVKRNSIPVLAGTAAGALAKGWPGAIAGGAIGGILPEVPEIMREGARGAVVGASGKPLVPSFMREHEMPNLSKPGVSSTPKVNAPMSEAQVVKPQSRIVAPQTKQLGPATSIQMPQGANLPNFAPEDDMEMIRRGVPNSTTSQPTPKETPRGMPPKPGEGPYEAANRKSLKVDPPPPNTQDVPSSLHSVNSSLPSADAISATPKPPLKPPITVNKPENFDYSGHTPSHKLVRPENTPSVTEKLPSSKALDSIPSDDSSYVVNQTPKQIREHINWTRSKSLPPLNSIDPSIENIRLRDMTPEQSQLYESSKFETPKVNKPDYAGDALKAAGLKKVEFKPAETAAKAAPVDTRMAELDKLIKAGRGDERGASLLKKKSLTVKVTPSPDRLQGGSNYHDLIIKNAETRVNAPKGTKAARNAEVQAEPEPPKKPHFTHEIMGDIAKSISDDKNKVTMQEVGRHIHQNDLGTYQIGEYNKDYGASRATKTGPRDSSNTKSAKDAIISAGIKKYIKDHPEKF